MASVPATYNLILKILEPRFLQQERDEQICISITLLKHHGSNTLYFLWSISRPCWINSNASVSFESSRKKHAKFIGFARMHKEQSANFCLSNVEKWNWQANHPTYFGSTPVRTSLLLGTNSFARPVQLNCFSASDWCTTRAATMFLLVQNSKTALLTIRMGVSSTTLYHVIRIHFSKLEWLLLFGAKSSRKAFKEFVNKCSKSHRLQFLIH